MDQEYAGVVTENEALKLELSYMHDVVRELSAKINELERERENKRTGADVTLGANAGHLAPRVPSLPQHASGGSASDGTSTLTRSTSPRSSYGGAATETVRDTEVGIVEDSSPRHSFGSTTSGSMNHHLSHNNLLRGSSDLSLLSISAPRSDAARTWRESSTTPELSPLPGVSSAEDILTPAASQSASQSASQGAADTGADAAQARESARAAVRALGQQQVGGGFAVASVPVLPYAGGGGSGGVSNAFYTSAMEAHRSFPPPPQAYTRTGTHTSAHTGAHEEHIGVCAGGEEGAYMSAHDSWNHTLTSSSSQEYTTSQEYSSYSMGATGGRVPGPVHYGRPDAGMATHPTAGTSVGYPRPQLTHSTTTATGGMSSVSGGSIGGGAPVASGGSVVHPEDMGKDMSLMRCRHCGQYGHIMRYCRMLTCFHCGNSGHMASVCPSVSGGGGGGRRPDGHHSHGPTGYYYPHQHQHPQQQQQYQQPGAMMMGRGGYPMPPRYPQPHPSFTPATAAYGGGGARFEHYAPVTATPRGSWGMPGGYPGSMPSYPGGYEAGGMAPLHSSGTGTGGSSGATAGMSMTGGMSVTSAAMLLAMPFVPASLAMSTSPVAYLSSAPLTSGLGLPHHTHSGSTGSSGGGSGLGGVRHEYDLSSAPFHTR